MCLVTLLSASWLTLRYHHYIVDLLYILWEGKCVLILNYTVFQGRAEQKWSFRLHPEAHAANKGLYIHFINEVFYHKGLQAEWDFQSTSCGRRCSWCRTAGVYDHCSGFENIYPLANKGILNEPQPGRADTWSQKHSVGLLKVMQEHSQELSSSKDLKVRLKVLF